jgi:hypothetical protein
MALAKDREGGGPDPVCNEGASADTIKISRWATPFEDVGCPPVSSAGALFSEPGIERALLKRSGGLTGGAFCVAR